MSSDLPTKQVSEPVRRLTSDGKILFALKKKQPQTMRELATNTGLNYSTVKKRKLILEYVQLVKNIGTKRRITLVLHNYADWKTKLEDTFIKYSIKYQGEGQVSILDLAYRCGESPATIEDEAWRLSKKYGVRIGETSDPTLERMDRRSLSDVMRNLNKK